MRYLLDASFLAFPSNTDTLAVLRSALLTKAAGLQAISSAYIVNLQVQYKGDPEKVVIHQPTITVDEEVFVKRSPPAVDTLAEQIADMPKVRPRSLGPFPVEEITENTVVVEFSDEYKHVAIDLAIKVTGLSSDLPRLPSLSPPPFEDRYWIVDFRTSRKRPACRVGRWTVSFVGSARRTPRCFHVRLSKTNRCAVPYVVFLGVIFIRSIIARGLEEKLDSSSLCGRSWCDYKS